jgi:hypothetical protein
MRVAILFSCVLLPSDWDLLTKLHLYADSTGYFLPLTPPTGTSWNLATFDLLLLLPPLLLPTSLPLPPSPECFDTSGHSGLRAEDWRGRDGGTNPSLATCVANSGDTEGMKPDFCGLVDRGLR